MATVKKLLKYAAIAAVWFSAWLIASMLVKNSVILPSPHEVLQRLFVLSSSGEFWLSILYSILRVVFGLIIATAAAILLSAAAFRFTLIRDFLKPFITVIKATPVVSFIFIAFVAFRGNFDSLPAFIAGLIVFPVMYESILAALIATPKELVEVSEVFGCTFYEKLRYLWIPTALPTFVTSEKTSIGLAWKSGVAAESLIAIPGLLAIGTEISEAKTWLETTDQFAWTLVIILLSLSIEIIFSFLAKKLTDKIL